MKESGFPAQILIDLKSADPTALTAEEAIRNLLKYGDRLAGLCRRVLHEFVLTCSGAPQALAAPLPGGGSVGESRAEATDLLVGYLARTVLLWNSNKHRAWLRLDEGQAWEIHPSATQSAGSFGRPSLNDPGYDHLVIWNRAGEAPPEDFPHHVDSLRIAAYHRSEIYSIAWRGCRDSAERREWTESVAVARSRGSGLLINPHYQDSLHFSGTVPFPVWNIQ